MDTAAIERLIEETIPDAEATVGSSRHEEDEEHFAALVISPAFEGKTLVQQHQMVYDALGEHMTTDIHAMEIKTYTPEEYESADVDVEPSH
jgi:stress-induced morphogen